MNAHAEGARRRRIIAWACGLAAGMSMLDGGTSRAFSGFYVAAESAPKEGPKGRAHQDRGPLLEPASMVVLMREGTRTVVSIESSYVGSADAFAMVVPVPVLLKKEDLKVLSRTLFEHIDELTAPRLVETWERDPCAVAAERSDAGVDAGHVDAGKGHGRRHGAQTQALPGAERPEVPREVHADTAFQVGEYDVALLSATESRDPSSWLRTNHFVLPEGAESLLAEYVERGSFFLVARVNPAKMAFTRGVPGGPRFATLSPLRFFYDEDRFDLPIRPALLNSDGVQDLIVNILARHQRYEVGDRGNVAAPTSLLLGEVTSDAFASTYAAIFDRLLLTYPGAAVTEYARSATSCDGSCPVAPLNPRELLALGADVLPAAPGERERATFGSGFVLSRVHLRYAPDGAPTDLSFTAAGALVGGGSTAAPNPALPNNASPDGYSDFQTKYLVRHPWAGETACDAPIRDVWSNAPPGSTRAARPHAATNLAFAKRGDIDLASAVMGDVPALGLTAASAAKASPVDPPTDDAGLRPPSQQEPARGCGACGVQGKSAEGSARAGWLVAIFALLVGVRRRRAGR